MQFDQGFTVTPFRFVFSFATLIARMNRLAEEDALYASRYREILEEARLYPELLQAVDYHYLESNAGFLKRLLCDIFPPPLTENEIKAVGIPYANFLFNPTARLRTLLDAAGDDFELKFNNLSQEQSYIISCCVILNRVYRTSLKLDTPLIYSIPNREGYLNHYRILTNADFLEINPTEKSVVLSPEDVVELCDHADDIELWMRKFPPNSWELKGFAVVSFYDATIEVALSDLKSLVFQPGERKDSVEEDVNRVFRSIFRSKRISIGFTEIDINEKTYRKSLINRVIRSNIMKPDTQKTRCEPDFLETLKNKKYYTLPDVYKHVRQYPDSFLASHYHDLGYRSVIFAPVFRQGKLLGVIEVTSKAKNLNSINAHKLDDMMPFLEYSIDQIYSNLENHVAAEIQREYTSIHPSVYWKFRNEALRHVLFKYEHPGEKLAYQNIAFKDVFPHFGQTDIRDSSFLRNNAIIQDLLELMNSLTALLQSLSQPGIKGLVTQVKKKVRKLQYGLKADTESEIQRFLAEKVNPVLQKLQSESSAHHRELNSYFSRTEDASPHSGSHRKRFDESISVVNSELSNLIDDRQEEQQKIFPFYYERFATDGVEHNLYLGQSIAPWLSYNTLFLKNLRIWQLKVMIECECLFKKLKDTHALPFDISSLVLAYGNSISIRFRMDEKRFDVDGSYNAGYEVIKKRIDKSLIRDSQERLVEPGKLCIVFAQPQQQEEYMNYIRLLQSEDLLHHDTEILEIEELQGITGLKAIRVSINFGCKPVSYSFYKNI